MGGSRVLPNRHKPKALPSDCLPGSVTYLEQDTGIYIVEDVFYWTQGVPPLLDKVHGKEGFFHRQRTLILCSLGSFLVAIIASKQDRYAFWRYADTVESLVVIANPSKSLFVPIPQGRVPVCP